jgi:hypothetical protein
MKAKTNVKAGDQEDYTITDPNGFVVVWISETGS